MKKSYYITEDLIAKDYACKKAAIYGQFLIKCNGNERPDHIRYIIEDNEENRDWLLIQKLKGIISEKIEFDLEILDETNAVYDLQNKFFFFSVVKNGNAIDWI
jgi:hypothetical protein